jgi:hypothetical protein
MTLAFQHERNLKITKTGVMGIRLRRVPRACVCRSKNLANVGPPND